MLNLLFRIRRITNSALLCARLLAPTLGGIAALMAASALAGGVPDVAGDPAAEAGAQNEQPPVSNGEPDEEPDTVKVAALDDGLYDRIMVIGRPENVSRIPGAVGRVGIESLEEQHYSDIHRILRQIPGINIQEEDGYGLRPNIGMRGTGIDRSAKITLMEDGVLLAPAPYAAPAAYFFPQTGRMEAVEVRKGSSSIKFGPATTGGAINLVSTSIPEDYSGTVRLRAGSDQFRQAHAYVGGSGKKLGFLAETYQSDSDGFKNLDGGGDTGFNIEEFVGKVRFSSGNDWDHYQEMEVKVSYTDQKSDETYLGLTDADFALTPNRRYAASALDLFDGKHYMYQARHLFEFSDTFDLTSVAYFNRFKRNWFKIEKVSRLLTGGNSDTAVSSVLADPDSYAGVMAVLRGEADSPADALMMRNNNRSYDSYGAQTVLSAALDMERVRHDLEFSIRYHRDKMDRFQWWDRFAMSDGALVQTTSGVPGTESNRIDSAEAVAAFVQDEISIGRWLIIPGLRYEHVVLRRKDFGKADPERSGTNIKLLQNTVDVFIPGVGVKYEATESFSLVLGVHRGFTPPAPGKTADEERSVNYEAGARFSHGELAVEAIGFFTDYSNLIGTCTASTGGACNIGDQFNGGNVNVLGLELSADYDLAESFGGEFKLPLRASYTYTDAKFRTSFDSAFGPFGAVEKGDELPYTPRHQFTVGLGAEARTWRLFLSLNHVGAVRNRAGAGPIEASQRVDAHTVIDLAGHYDLTDYLEFFLSVQNLGNQTYSVARRPAGLRPGKPRTAIGGLALTF